MSKPSQKGSSMPSMDTFRTLHILQNHCSLVTSVVLKFSIKSDRVPPLCPLRSTRRSRNDRDSYKSTIRWIFIREIAKLRVMTMKNKISKVPARKQHFHSNDMSAFNEIPRQFYLDAYHFSLESQSQRARLICVALLGWTNSKSGTVFPPSDLGHSKRGNARSMGRIWRRSPSGNKAMRKDRRVKTLSEGGEVTASRCFRSLTISSSDLERMLTRVLHRGDNVPFF